MFEKNLMIRKIIKKIGKLKVIIIIKVCLFIKKIISFLTFCDQPRPSQGINGEEYQFCRYFYLTKQTLFLFHATFFFFSFFLFQNICECDLGKRLHLLKKVMVMINPLVKT